MKNQFNNDSPQVNIAPLVRCVWRNFASSMIINPILGLFLLMVCEIGQYPKIEKVIAALIGLNTGWILGMAALLFVVKFDPAINIQSYP